MRRDNWIGRTLTMKDWQYANLSFKIISILHGKWSAGRFINLRLKKKSQSID